jgi:hypothetical protein
VVDLPYDAAHLPSPITSVPTAWKAPP